MRYAIAAALWVGWGLPFLHKAVMPREKAVVRDPSARWGIILEGVSYGLMWGIPQFEVSLWRIALGLIFGAVSIVITRLALRHLDKQWRVDAALNANHELISTGPYSLIRHPIYAGMLAMLVAQGFLLTRWPVFAIGIVMFVVGTEIRIRAEDQLLRSRFGQQFEDYSQKVWAYVPFVR